MALNTVKNSERHRLSAQDHTWADVSGIGTAKELTRILRSSWADGVVLVMMSLAALHYCNTGVQ